MKTATIKRHKGHTEIRAFYRQLFENVSLRLVPIFVADQCLCKTVILCFEFIPSIHSIGIHHVGG